MRFSLTGQRRQNSNEKDGHASSYFHLLQTWKPERGLTKIGVIYVSWRVSQVLYESSIFIENFREKIWSFFHSKGCNANGFGLSFYFPVKFVLKSVIFSYQIFASHGRDILFHSHFCNNEFFQMCPMICQNTNKFYLCGFKDSFKNIFSFHCFTSYRK